LGTTVAVLMLAASTAEKTKNQRRSHRMNIFERELLAETLREELEQRGYDVSREHMWHIRRLLKSLDNVDNIERFESILAAEERGIRASA
jgi:hypothetical protein